MVTVLAGQEETPFIIHRNNLCQTSEFFKSELSGDDADDTVSVPSVRAGIFEVYVNWIYRGDVKLSLGISQTAASIDANHISAEDSDFRRLSELYVAGIVLGDVALKNNVIDELMMCMERWGSVGLSTTLTTYIWKGTLPESTLRKIFLDYLIGNTDPAEPFSGDTYHRTAHPHEFFFDLAERSLRVRDRKADLVRPKIAKRCCYHFHHGPETDEEEWHVPPYTATTSTTYTSIMSSKQVTSSLSSLLPTLSPLPDTLVDLATSLVAQSRARASTLKPEEEIARTYACCHIACERLGKKLGLEVGKPAPPCQPRVYTKLKTYLSSVLRTPTTPRSAARTGNKPASGRGDASTGASAVKPAEPNSAGRSLRGTPSKRPAPVAGSTPSKRLKRTAAASPTQETAPSEVAAPATNTAQEEEEEHDQEPDEDIDDEPTPVRRPAKTPLRRKEKHAKRDSEVDEDLGAAGLLPGLGTMFQPALDWLSDERRADYKLWEKDIYREMAAIRRQEVG
ncbi:hypothetical protein LTR27_006386 [Elasticomyces elasticus]|nr:hypothetical protein LTR27_006386 [Elasticomyces elasticus]